MGGRYLGGVAYLGSNTGLLLGRGLLLGDTSGLSALHDRLLLGLGLRRLFARDGGSSVDRGEDTRLGVARLGTRTVARHRADLGSGGKRVIIIARQNAPTAKKEAGIGR